jgi:hypothetical protein
LRQAQEKLERERTALEEARRQRSELSLGFDEMMESLPKGIAMLEEFAFKARQDSEQMGNSLDGLQHALTHVKSIDQDAWTEESYQEELSRALGIVENARMEWNSCRLKWPALDAGHDAGKMERNDSEPSAPQWASLSKAGFWTLCRLGLGLTWPVAMALLLLGGTALGIWWSQQ